MVALLQHYKENNTHATLVHTSAEQTMSQRVFAGLLSLIIYKCVCQCFMISFAGALGQIQVIRLALFFYSHFNANTIGLEPISTC